MRIIFQLIAKHALNPQRVEQLEAELRPEGILEDIFAAQIIRSTLRLDHEDRTDEDRASITLAICRSTAELRRLQTDRQLKAEFSLDLPGLISAKDVLRFRRQAEKQEKSPKRKTEPNSEPVSSAEATLDGQIQDEQRKLYADFAKRTQNTDRNPAVSGRNDPCPCKSGQKYKRCCGHWSKQANAAA